jgi:hypothetical protein
MSLESAAGRAKNAKNMLQTIRVLRRREENVPIRKVEYALSEVDACLKEIEDFEGPEQNS